MTHEIETQWMGKMQFNALVNGHTVVMDAPERIGVMTMDQFPNLLFYQLYQVVQEWMLLLF